MIVGLTGGIGSGKSTVAQMFRELGVPVYDSDMGAKKMMVSSSKVKNAIIELLGKSAYKKGKLNRSFIAGKVFKNPHLLSQLNAVVHPAVKKHFLAWAKDQSSIYVIQETALVFENNSQDQYDYVILVTAPQDIRLQRAVLRNGEKENDIRDRMGNQLEDSKKMALANFHIENIDMETTRIAVEKLHNKLIRLQK